jgi:hypothetical protein
MAKPSEMATFVAATPVLASPEPAAFQLVGRISKLNPDLDVVAVNPVPRPAKVVPLGNPIFRVRTEAVRLVNPDLGNFISKIPPLDPGIPRSQVTVPISPVVDLTDQVLFEDTAGTTKYYLARYRLSEEAGRFQLSLEKSDSGGSLSLLLESYPAPEVATFQNAQPLTASISIILRHLYANGGEKELVFQEVTAEGSKLRGVLRLSSLIELTQLYEAMTIDVRAASVIVRRAVKVAVPASGIWINPDSVVRHGRGPSPSDSLSPIRGEGEPKFDRFVKSSGAGGRDAAGVASLLERRIDSGPVLSEGRGVIRGTWIFDLDKGAEGSDGDIWWVQQTQTQREMAAWRNSRIVNLGLVDFATLSVTDLQGLQFSQMPINGNNDASNQLVNGDVFAVVTNLGNYAKVQVLNYDYNIAIRWVTYAQVGAGGNPSPATFREVTRVVDNLIDPQPFVFPPELHGYIFRNISSLPGQSFALAWHQVSGHSYYQDPARPHVFFYLPDSFKIARLPQSPHYPFMSIRPPSNDASDGQQIALQFFAAPFVDNKRLAAAATPLRSLVTSFPAGVTTPVLEPLLVETNAVRFNLIYPRANAPADSSQKKEEFLIDLRAGIWANLMLSVEELQAVYDALFGAGGAVLFGGSIQISLGDGTRNPEPIPFAARMDDLVGDIFDYEGEPDPASGVVKVILRNAIESPVNIKRLNATLRQNQTEVPALIQDPGFTPPVKLNPGEAASFSVVPSAPLPGGGDLTAAFDLSGVETLPDPEKIFDTLAGSIPPQTSKDFTVRATAATFAPSPNHPNDPISSILVDFKGDDAVVTVELNAQTLTAKATLRKPIRNLMLHRPDPPYLYRLTVIRNLPGVPSEWKPVTTDMFFADVEV